jgi:hypothetical protein
MDLSEQRIPEPGALWQRIAVGYCEWVNGEWPDDDDILEARAAAKHIATYVERVERVSGECPMGCGRTLFLGDGDHHAHEEEELEEMGTNPSPPIPRYYGPGVRPDGVIAKMLDGAGPARRGEADPPEPAISDAAVEAVVAARYGHIAPSWLLGRRADIRRDLAAALPHLLTDEMVERAADALWDQRVSEARAAIEAALGGHRSAVKD